jgi:hypothetical protein
MTSQPGNLLAGDSRCLQRDDGVAGHTPSSACEQDMNQHSMHTCKDAHYQCTTPGAEASSCTSSCTQVKALTWLLCMLSVAHPPAAALQVYLILDEFIMGGEMQETSKKVGLPAHTAAEAATAHTTSALRQHAPRCMMFHPCCCEDQMWRCLHKTLVPYSRHILLV